VFWWRWFRDDPAQHPSVNAEELRLIRESGESTEHFEMQWGSLLSLNLLWICLMYFCYGYSLYFYLTWMPTYLKDARGFSDQQVGLIHGFILFAAAGASILGGRLTDWLVKHRGLRIGRGIAAVAMPLSGIALTGAALTSSGIACAILLAAAAAAGDLCLSPAWAICHDVGKDAAGTVTGAMNTFGNLGGTLSPLVVGYAVQWWGSWSIPLLIAAAVSVIGGALTLLIDARKPLSS
jgi:nitrate/nitrite transporter NarK